MVEQDFATVRGPGKRVIMPDLRIWKDSFLFKNRKKFLFL
jgi:hypothetical protein